MIHKSAIVGHGWSTLGHLGLLHLIRTFHDSGNLVCQIACNNKWVSDSSGPGKASFCLTLAKCWSLLYHLLLFWKKTSFSTLIKLTECLKWHKYYSHILIHWHQLTQIFFLQSIECTIIEWSFYNNIELNCNFYCCTENSLKWRAVTWMSSTQYCHRLSFTNHLWKILQGWTAKTSTIVLDHVS